MKPSPFLAIIAGSLLAVGAAAATSGCAPAPYERGSLYVPPELDTSAPSSTDADISLASADASLPLTLETCIRIALARDRNLIMADRRVLIAHDRVEEAVASVRPSLSLDSRYEVRSNDQGSRVGGAALHFGSRDSGFANLNLLVPIYDFGGAAATKEALNLNVEVTQFDALARRQSTIFAVRLAYYRVLEAKSIQNVVSDSLKVVDRQLTVAQDFFGQGLVAKSDVLAAVVQKAQRLDEMIQADNNLQLAIATLNRLLGLELSRPTEIADLLDLPVWDASYEQTLGAAIHQRPELAGLRKQIDMARSQYQAMKAGGTYPHLYGYGSYNMSSDTTLLNQQWLVGGVGLRFPLFDGGVTYAQLLRQTNEIAQMIDLHDEKIDDVVLEIKQAWLNTHTVAREIPIAKGAVEVARENLALMQDQYAQGLVTSAEVLTEEDRLSHARGAYYRSLYGYNQAYSALLNATGGKLPEPLPEKSAPQHE